ncbi:MAG: DUF6576 domain-containing protein, partial [Rubricoccaceae bacterium]|nr:DUF6576 domain-containing protein [Rubricoccaceae bacterium]
VPLKWIALGFVLIDVLFGFDPTHLGGAAMGALFGYAQKRGIDLAAWSKSFFQRGGSIRMRTPARTSSGPKVWASKTARTAGGTGGSEKQESGFGKAVGNQAEVDRILDKILEKGYDSLSTDEKKILNDASKRS